MPTECPVPFHLNRLLDIMARLRDPERGCPWDTEQTFQTIIPYTIEEAYELSEAIEAGGTADIRDELGDLLLQVVFHARIAEEAGAFDFNSVSQCICEKMIRRHPHVFGSGASIVDTEIQSRAWEEHKVKERENSRSDAPFEIQSRLSGVTQSLPALTRAKKLQNRAAHFGFDWAEASDVLPKVREEIAELEQELSGNADPARLSEEIGDLLFATVNLARKLKIDAEAALREGNRKFERRFQAMETIALDRGLAFETLTLPEMEALWVEVKARESS